MTVERTHPGPEPGGDEPDVVDPAADEDPEDVAPEPVDSPWSDRLSRIGCLAVVLGAVALALLGAYAELRAVL